MARRSGEPLGMITLSSVLPAVPPSPLVQPTREPIQTSTTIWLNRVFVIRYAPRGGYSTALSAMFVNGLKWEELSQHALKSQHHEYCFNRASQFLLPYCVRGRTTGQWNPQRKLSHKPTALIRPHSANRRSFGRRVHPGAGRPPLEPLGARAPTRRVAGSRIRRHRGLRGSKSDATALGRPKTADRALEPDLRGRGP